MKSFLSDLIEEFSNSPMPFKVAFIYSTAIAIEINEIHKIIVKGHGIICPANIIISNIKQKQVTKSINPLQVKASILNRKINDLENLSYLSPEKVQKHKIDNRSDIWSLGTIMYKIFTGKSPFDGGNRQQIINSILYETPQPLREVCNDIPPKVEDLIMKALAKNREDRYKNIKEVLYELRIACLQFAYPQLFMELSINPKAAEKIYLTIRNELIKTCVKPGITMTETEAEVCADKTIENIAYKIYLNKITLPKDYPIVIFKKELLWNIKEVYRNKKKNRSFEMTVNLIKILKNQISFPREKKMGKREVISEKEIEKSDYESERKKEQILRKKIDRLLKRNWLVPEDEQNENERVDDDLDRKLNSTIIKKCKNVCYKIIKDVKNFDRFYRRFKEGVKIEDLLLEGESEGSFYVKFHRYKKKHIEFLNCLINCYNRHGLSKDEINIEWFML